MKRIFYGIMVAILLLHCCVFALAEEEVLTIAVLYSSDAENLPAEEAFFKRYPNAVIEYRLYTEEQLNTMLMTGTAEFDLAILPYQNMLNMAKKGYLTSINEVLGQDEYPEQLVDWSNLLTIDDWIFALPVSVAQQFWIWDENVATKAGLSMPEGNMWTWEDYANYATKLPKDTDGDGIADVYLMYGSYLLEYPLFRKVNLNMFTQYTVHFTDFDVFGAQYLDLFKEVLTGDALLDIPYLEKQGCFKGGVPGCLLWEKEKRFTPTSPTHPNRFHPTGADDSGSGACSFGPEMRGGRCADCYSRTERQPV